MILWPYAILLSYMVLWFYMIMGPVAILASAPPAPHIGPHTHTHKLKRAGHSGKRRPPEAATGTTQGEAPLAESPSPMRVDLRGHGAVDSAKGS